MRVVLCPPLTRWAGEGWHPQNGTTDKIKALTDYLNGIDVPVDAVGASLRGCASGWPRVEAPTLIPPAADGAWRRLT